MRRRPQARATRRTSPPSSSISRRVRCTRAMPTCATCASLAVLAGDDDIAHLSGAQVRRLLATLHGRGLSGRSLARTLSSWRAFYRHLIETDPAVRENPCTGLKAPKAPRRLPSALSPDEAVQLVAITGDDALDVRDRALFELAYSSGLRLSELAGLDVDRMDLVTGEVRVWGKGAKERIVPVGAPAREAIAAWLDDARRARCAGGDRTLRRPAGTAHHDAQHRAAACGLGGAAGNRSSRASAHAATFVRVARAAIVGRPARGAGDARPREHRQHAGLHPSRFPVPREGLRRGASAREETQVARQDQVQAAGSSSRMRSTPGSQGRSVGPGSMPACDIKVVSWPR